MEIFINLIISLHGIKTNTFYIQKTPISYGCKNIKTLFFSEGEHNRAENY